MNPYRPRKLIEVALPLDAINRECGREKSIRHGHPSTLHVWWARRPLAACRAVLFASLVDDPSSHPDEFPTEAEKDGERQRLFRIMEDLIVWENSNDERILGAARAEILRSTGGKPPAVLDPFCGGGSIPLEAQRLGLQALASDLNPVAVLITKALIEIPPQFADRPPVHPPSKKTIVAPEWRGAQGLADDIRHYGRWMRDEAEKRVGHLYPKATLPKELGGGEAPVLAWLWARTIRCPNPACDLDAPLIRSFSLSTRKGKEAWLVPVITAKASRVGFEVRNGEAKNVPKGTVDRGGARCLACGTAIPLEHIRVEAAHGRWGTQLMSIVAGVGRGRTYLPPHAEHEALAASVPASDALGTSLPSQALGFRVQRYGITQHSQLFTPRQLATLTVLSDLVEEARERVFSDAKRGAFPSDEKLLADGGLGARAYADAVSTYLGLTCSKAARFTTVLSFWRADEGKLSRAFGRQTVSMTWDFAETNPFAESGGDWEGLIDGTAAAIERTPASGVGSVLQLDAAQTLPGGGPFAISTDPPYYDNVAYADLSDIFYVWLRRSIRNVYPALLSTVLTPKSQELIADPFRFDGAVGAKRHFLEGMRQAFYLLRKASVPEMPLTVYYAFKQSEAGDTEEDSDLPGSDRPVSTGWETMLEGLVEAGFQVTATWPVRTEGPTRMRGIGSNALASSIVLACRGRSGDATLATRKEFLAILKSELPEAVRLLKHANVAPVDLAQAAIGPGMSVFSRYSRLIEADGSRMSVRSALVLINQVLDHVMAEEESEFDRDTRWALAWVEQFGMDDGAFGEADVLARAKDTAVEGLVAAGIIEARRGKVRLIRRTELPADWDPSADQRLTVWELTQYLIRRLQSEGGEMAAAELVRSVGGLAEAARDLAYRLFTVCERKRWAAEATAYNGLVLAWPEITRLASRTPAGAGQADLFR